MKTSDHEQKLHSDGTEKPGFQKILACHGDFRNPRGGGIPKNSALNPRKKSAGKSRYRQPADL
jgi:hypothetical protein